MNHRRWCAEYKTLPVFSFWRGAKSIPKHEAVPISPCFVEKYFVKYATPAPPHAAVVAQWGWMQNDTTVRSPEVYVPSLTPQEAGGKVQWSPIASCLRQDDVYKYHLCT